jgi:GNAT superfamily N-acetyltransferase
MDRVIEGGLIPLYRVTIARRRDLPLLAPIELAAATLLRGHAPDSVLRETTDERELTSARSEGRLWVALADDVPVGFAIIDVLWRDLAHLEEVDVHPDHGRCGHGGRLVAAVCDWASRRGYLQVTLMTFRDVPWNMPFYVRLGFEAVPEAEVPAEVRAIVDDETQRGLDPTRRVVMRYRCVDAGRPRART